MALAISAWILLHSVIIVSALGLLTLEKLKILAGWIWKRKVPICSAACAAIVIPWVFPWVLVVWLVVLGSLKVSELGMAKTKLWTGWLMLTGLMILGGALLLWVFLDPLTGIPLLTLGQAAVFVTLLPPALWGLNLGRRAVWEMLMEKKE